MKKYYFANYTATPCMKVYEMNERPAELPKHWREITEEEYKNLTAQDWERVNED